MDLSFYPLTLEAIDQAAAESLCLFIAADERPLTGLAGLADWRLSGRLSRLLRGGLLTGDAGEAVLTPPGSRLAFQKLFLFGVGKTGQTEEELARRVAEALRKLAQAGVQEAALQLPARLPVEVGIRTLIDEMQGPGRALLFAPDPQKLVMALSHAASRGSAQLERRVVKVPAPPTPQAVKPVLPPVKVQQQRPTPPLAQAVAPAAAVALPKATPLPFAPQRDVPAQQLGPLTPPPPQSTPKASPLPFAPAAAPLPTGPTPSAPLPSAPLPSAATPSAPLPSAPTRSAPLPSAATPSAPLPSAPTPSAPLPAGPAAAPPTPPPPASAEPPAAEEKRPAPPPSQRYVPPPPKPHVFETGRKKK